MSIKIHASTKLETSVFKITTLFVLMQLFFLVDGYCAAESAYGSGSGNGTTTTTTTTTKTKTKTKNLKSKNTAQGTTSKVRPKTAVTKKTTITVNKQIEKIDSEKIDNNSDPLYVDGTVSEGGNKKVDSVDSSEEEQDVADSELNFINNELTKQKQQIKLNDKKSKGYKKLQTTTEKLSDTTEKYVEEKKESEKIIKDYNEKINCLLDENNLDPACEKYKKSPSRRDEQVVQETNEPTEQNDQILIAPVDHAPVVSAPVNETSTAPLKDAAAAAANNNSSTNSNPLIIQNFNNGQPNAVGTEAPILNTVQTKSAAPAAPVVVTPAAPIVIQQQPLANFPGIDDEDESESQSYSPVSTKKLTTEKEAPKGPDMIRIIPYLGMKSYNGSGINGNQTNSSFGLRIESEVVSRFILGVGFQYDTLQSTDLNNRNNYWGGYYNYFGNNGREIQYTSWTLDFIGKLIIIKGEKFIPYIGGAIGYNNGELSYTDNRQYPYLGVTYGDNESISTSFVSGSIIAGTDFLFTPNIGLNVEMAFSKGLSNLNQQNINYFDLDMQRLQELSGQFAESASISLRAGVSIIF
ncbi:MAG: hypothetical protein QE271_03640 [Bacteriovoracaceae bacterium]|nr:hypothetical protein [Bacteriovoracaceae bacterium]